MIKQILNKPKQLFSWVFKSKLRILSLVILVGLIIFSGYKVLGVKQIAPQYQTSAAEKGTLVTSISASGAISSAGNVNITTTASGVVSNVYVKNGDSVYQGQIIADVQLDQDGQVKQASAWASYVSASSSLLNAQNNLRSTQASLDKTLDDIHLYQYGNGGESNVGSANETATQKQQRTASEVAKDNATNSVRSAQAGLNAAALSYQQISSSITAPTSGVINNLTITPGFLITSTSSSSSNSTTTASTSLGNITLNQKSLQATVNLSEIDVTKVSPSQKVTLTLDAFPGKTFTGVVSSINTNGSVSSGVTTYPATITFDSAVSNIYPNMAVSGKIITNIKNDVILVPSSAVTTSNGANTVRVLKNGNISIVDVELGDSNDTQTEITSGINEGDQVITSSVTSATSAQSTGNSPFSTLGGARGGFGGGTTVIRGR